MQYKVYNIQTNSDCLPRGTIIESVRKCTYFTKIHYVALKNVFRYFRHTKEDGLVFWRSKEFICKHIQLKPLPNMHNDAIIQKEILEDEHHNYDNGKMIGFVNSDWAGDTSHRRSITCIAILFVGAVIAYKSRIQKTIALSSSEAEFVAACEAGQMILYLRTILEEMGVDQDEPTLLYEDNQGALLMANAQQPTRRTRHIETVAFTLQDWIARDLLNMTYIESSKNSSDGMTKPLPRVLFYKHFDVLMGRNIPQQFQHMKKNKYTKEERKTERADERVKEGSDTTINTKDSHANDLPNI